VEFATRFQLLSLTFSSLFSYSYSFVYRRGEDLRGLKFAQLQRGILASVGPTTCYVIGASLRDVSYN
jgi:hypothetical protein